MKNFTFVRSEAAKRLNSYGGVSPLALLTLAACGGGGGGGGGASTAAPATATVSGHALKGPLVGATAFLDYDGDGVKDANEPSVQTGAGGAFSFSSLTAAQAAAPIVVTTKDTTDTSSGAQLSGVTLKAAGGSKVVSPMTTLTQENGLTAAQVAKALGLPAGVNPLTFNPYAAGVDAANALAVEKVSQQIISTVNAIAGVADGAGATQADAFAKALGALADVVKTKADAGTTFDFKVQADLDAVKTGVTTKLKADTNFDTAAQTKYDAAITDAVTGAKNINDKIGGITSTDLTLLATKNIFSTTQLLKDQATAAGAAGTVTPITLDKAAGVDAAVLNPTPTDLSFSASAIVSKASVAENTAIVTKVATITPTDASTTDTFTFALVGTDAEKAAFTLTTAGNSLTADLFLKAVPDFEDVALIAKSHQYSISVKVTDAGGKSFVKPFTVDITNVNETPTDLYFSRTPTSREITVAENTQNLFLDNVWPTDPDKGDTFTYSLTAGLNADKFSIDSTSGKLSLIKSPDYELMDASHAYTVKVRATDAGSLFVEKTFTVKVTDVPLEAPTDVSFSSTTKSVHEVSVAENTIKGAPALTFSALTTTDTDQVGGAFAYALVSGGDAGKFTIDAATGALTLTESPNYEVLKTQGYKYSVSVKVTDADSQSYTQALTVKVTNVNEAPTDINLTGYLPPPTGETVGTVFIPEDFAGGIARIFVTPRDPDETTGDKYTFLLTGTGSDASKFTIVPGKSTDTLSSAETATITLNAPLDYEALKLAGELSYTLKIKVTDTGDSSGANPQPFEKDFKVVITDVVNEQPTDIYFTPTAGLHEVSIAENAAIGTLVGNIKVADQEHKTGETYTYEMQGNAKDMFTFTAGTGAADNTGVLTWKKVPDFETSDIYRLFVKVTETYADGTSKFFTQQLNIKVTDVNEKPTDLSLSASSSVQTVSIAENILAVGTITTTDPDKNDTFTYALSGTNSNLFSITSGGVLTLKAKPDFETMTSPYTYSVDVTATDGGAKTGGSGTVQTLTKTFTVTITDAAEAPAFTSVASAAAATDGAAIGSVIYTAAATDPDASSASVAVIYSISGGTDAAKVTIDAATGKVTLTEAASISANPVLDFTVKATDGATSTLFSEQAVSITVGVNHKPSFSASSGTGLVNENADVSTAIYTAKATDDATDKNPAAVIYSISGGVDADKVQIDAATGAVTLRNPADRATNTKYDFIVKAADATNSTLFSTQAVSVIVTNQNDAPTGASQYISMDTGSAYVFKASDFKFADVDGDALSKVKIVGIHESKGGELTKGGIAVTAGDVIAVGDIPNLKYTPGVNEVGDAYARISFKVNDGTTYSESSNHIGVNVKNAPTLKTSPEAKKATGDANGQTHRLLDVSQDPSTADTTLGELNRLMTGAGWSAQDGTHDQIYMTYSFYQSGSDYKGAWFTPSASLVPMTATGQAAVTSALQQIEKFTNIKFIKVDDTTTNFGDLRFTTASSTFMDKSLGAGYFPGYSDRYGGYSSQNGDVFLRQFSDANFSTPGSEAYYTVLHEIGHSLGLAHPFHTGTTNPLHTFGTHQTIGTAAKDSSIYTVMSYGFDGWTRSDPTDSTYMVDDVRAFQALYGTNTVFSSGNNIYDYSFFSADQSGFIKSIYDAGGTDTFDFTNQGFQTTGTLTKNGYLFVDGNLANGVVNNIADVDILKLLKHEGVIGMANSQIEQFFGGTGVDTITASTSGNVLFGGFAPSVVDIFTGNIGVDTFLVHDSGFLTTDSECDVIKTFDIAKDKIGLEFGLVYSATAAASDIVIEYSGGHAYLKNKAGSYLLKIEGVTSGLTASNFETTTYLKNAIGVLENSAPVIISGSELKVDTASTNVGYVSTKDADSNRLHYKLAKSDDHDKVLINKDNGLITLKSVLTKGQKLSVTVEVSDGIATVSKKFSIVGTDDGGVLSILDREVEPNDVFASANAITLGTKITGTTSTIIDKDYFELPETATVKGTVSIAFTSSGSDAYSHHVSILDANQNVLSSQRINGGGTIVAEIDAKAKYYVLVDESLDTNAYNLKATFSATKGVRETEPNNDIAHADTILSTAAIKGQSSSSTDVDYYKLDVSSGGTVSVAFDDLAGSNIRGHTVSIIDSDGTTVLSTKNILSSGTVKAQVGSGDAHYYVKVDGSYDTADYTLTATLSVTTATGARETEPNNDILHPDTLTKDVKITGHTSSSTDVDFYALTLTTASSISLAFTGDGTNYDYHSVSILATDGTTVLATKRLNGAGTVVANAGEAGKTITYYVKVDNSYDTADYSLIATVTDSVVSARESEPNNAIVTANLLTKGVDITGQTSSDTDVDYYRLNGVLAGEDITVTFTGGGDSNYHSVSILDASGNVLTTSRVNAAGKVVAKAGLAGDYYVKIGDSQDTGDYTLSATHAAATIVRESEPNNDIAHADVLTLDTTISKLKVVGQTSSRIDNDYYELSVTGGGTITVKFDDGAGNLFRTHRVSIVDDAGKVLSSDRIASASTVTAEVTTAGANKYYVKVSSSYDTADYTVIVTSSAATGTRETEPNNLITAADALTDNVAITGQSSSYSDIDYYKLDAAGAGAITVNFSDGSGSGYRFHTVGIYSYDGTTETKLTSGTVYSKGFLAANITTTLNTTYYIKVHNSFDTADYTITAKYNVTSSTPKPASTREVEPNNDIAHANTITDGTGIIGQAANRVDKDYYKFTMAQDGLLSVLFDDGSGHHYKAHYVSIYDVTGTKLLAQKGILSTGTVQASVVKGTYYILVHDSRDIADYTLTASSVTKVGEYESELNNAIKDADPLTSGVKITGQSSDYFDKDYYALDAVIGSTGTGTIKVVFNDEAGVSYLDHHVSIVDATGAVLSGGYIYANGTITAEVGTAGKYYVLVTKGFDAEEYSITATATANSVSTPKRETEPNNDIAHADVITSGVSIIGQTSDYTLDDDYYKLVVTNKGSISVTFDDGAGLSYYSHNVSIVDSSGNVLARKDILSSGTVTAEIKSTTTATDYYLLVDDSHDTADYTLTATSGAASTADTRETEPNNSFAAADLLKAGTVMTGQTSSRADEDYFQITMASAGTARVSFTSDGSDQQSHNVRLYDVNRNEILNTRTNGDGAVDVKFASGGSIYAYVGKSFDQDDYTIGWSEVV